MSSFDEKTKAEKKADRIDVAIDVAAVVLSTLKDVAKLSPIPGLSDSAGLAISIIGIVQKARSNKGGFKSLAEDSAELVYAIVHAHKDKVRPEDIPKDLNDNLQQLVATLTGVQNFAKKGASRGFFKAFLRANVDAAKIQDYREKLRQSMRVFGLQSDMSLRESVHKLAAQQEEIIKGLQNRPAGPGGANAAANSDNNTSVNPEYIALRAVGGGFARLVESIHGDVQIEAISGDKISNTVTNTVTNTNSGNVMVGSTLNTGNTTTSYVNTYH